MKRMEELEQQQQQQHDNDDEFIDMNQAVTDAMDTFGIDKDAMAKNVGNAVIGSLFSSGSSQQPENQKKKSGGGFGLW